MTLVGLLQRLINSTLKVMRRLRASFSLATIIAACAMILTGVQAWTTVYTAKIQTIPDLQFFEAKDVNARPGCGEVDLGIGPGTAVLCIENTGIGPARIISMAATFDDHTFEIPSVSWGKILDYFPGDAASSITFFTDIVRTQTIPAGKSIPLLRFKPTSMARQAPVHQLIQSGRFNMSFCYCNFYHDCQNVAIGPPNVELGKMKCESTQKRWWHWFEPEIKLPSARV